LQGKPVTTIALCTLLLMASTVGGAGAEGFNGRVSLGYGYLTHPIGLTTERAAGYLSQRVWLAQQIPSGESLFQVGYEGMAYQFGNDTHLGSLRHGFGLEWFRNAKDGSQGLSAGLQWGLRKYDTWYDLYNYQEGYGYFAFKRFIGLRTQLRGYVAVRKRIYGDLPEESSIEPHGQLELRHYSESKTTLGLRVRYGIKKFNDVAASQVWETLNLPSTSQVAARLNFAQGVSDRLGLRGWFDIRWNLDDYPHYVEADIFDSPILDRYAHDGWDAWAFMKILTPWQIWLEMGVGGGVHDYGSLLFAGAEGGLSRKDEILEFTLSGTRRLGAKLGRPDLRVEGGWRRQDSTHYIYHYRGGYFSTSLAWRF